MKKFTKFSLITIGLSITWIINHQIQRIRRDRTEAQIISRLQARFSSPVQRSWIQKTHHRYLGEITLQNQRKYDFKTNQTGSIQALKAVNPRKSEP